MASLQGAAEVVGLGRLEAMVLEGLGWSMARLGTLNGSAIEELQTIQMVWATCRNQCPEFNEDFDLFLRLVELSDELSQSCRVAEAKRGASAWASAHHEHEDEQKRRRKTEAREDP